MEDLETFFYNELTDLSQNYGSYSDLTSLLPIELWRHANAFGYKEQRQIFQDCSLNNDFYYHNLRQKRELALALDPYFNWLIYIQNYNLPIKSEYYALVDFLNRRGNPTCETIALSHPTTQIMLYAENSRYQHETFPFHYGAGLESSEQFGMVVPFRSKLLRVYFIYQYGEDLENGDFSFNTLPTSVKLNMYIDGSSTDYYVEETLDPSKPMVVGLLKEAMPTTMGCVIYPATPILEQNTILSWYCSELVSFVDDNYIHNPYNPYKNRFVLVLEPL